MKRHIPGLHRENRNRMISWKASSWSASTEPSIAGIPNGRSTSCGSPFSNPKNIRPIPSPAGSTALQSSVETQLVPAGFWLRP